MEYLVTGKEMQSYDKYTIEQIGLPALVLMERAALKALEAIEKVLPFGGRVLCVCGTGNNGGDGLSLARLLLDKKIETSVVLIGEKSRVTKETALQLSILEKYGVTPHVKVPDGEYDIIVDALLGTGLSREPAGDYRQAVEDINRKNGYKLSIDMPSGIHADTGKVLGVCVKADETVTLAFLKRGLYLYPGALYAGQITLADIGITERSFAAGAPQMYTRRGSVLSLLPERKKNGNKGTFGKVLLVAGSEAMAGAAILAAESCYRTGAGMVKLVIPEKIRVIVQEKLPEALIQVYESAAGLSDKEKELFLENTEWADVIAAGPGLSTKKSGEELLALAVTKSKKPLVIDADGLNLLAASDDLQEALKKSTKDGRTVILTPHMGELARLLQKPVAEVVEDETAYTMETAKKFGCIVVGKSARTQVCKNGAPIFLNTAGNDLMATAGSGDVLTGMITALLAQGMEPFSAAECGVYLHACAGDAAKEKCGGTGMLASYIIEGISLLQNK